MGELTVGTRVKLKDEYVDEARTRPVTGTIQASFSRAD